MADIALKVTCRGTYVALNVDVPGVDSFEFALDARSEWAAKLLANAVRDRLGKAAQSVRESAYNEGWKAAKAKRAKRTLFDTLWGVW